MALNAPLLQTSTTPIWVHPLAWSLNHLNLLRIFVHPVPEGANPREQDTGPTSGGQGRLSVGYISSEELRFVHLLHREDILDTYLATFIAKTVDTFQRGLRSKPFRFKSAE